ncbi:MAG: DUF3570 domain-containing protein [Proteobacteria bacterium]|nr:DUF3570 domain-containing protein [Pseudomonadota bacterium]
MSRLRLFTLLFLSVCAAPAITGVLPDDRTDALYHRYQGGGITIQGPSVLVQKKITDNFALNGNWYQDYISSASIDVKLSASPYKEKRTQESAGFQYLHGKATYSAGLIHSTEPDYKSNTTYYSISQDMFGDLTTLSMTYKRGWDKVYKDFKDPTTGQIRNDPAFGGLDKDNNPISFKDADHRGYSIGLSQILTRTLIGSFNYEVLTDQGYLQSPYRQILYLNPLSGKGFTLADQIYPNTRTSNAGSVQLKYYLPYRAAVTGSYRYFSDTWGIHAHTAEVGYTHPAFKKWIFDGSFRFYTQNAASFFSDLFPRANSQNFMARDRELAAFNSYTVGVGASYDFPLPRNPWVNRSTFSVRFDHLLIDYKDYRNALLIGANPDWTAGNEPLYKLNANILQAFLSVWF